jgi:predicted Holliday junction resolvase-like endonuclease
MIAMLLPLLIRMGVPQRFAKAVLFILLAVLLVSLLGIAKCSYDRSVIAKHEVKVEKKIRKAETKATKAADKKDAVVRARNDADAAKLKEKVDEAVKAHPDAVKRASGPASNAALRELRRRRAAEDRKAAR